MACDVVMLTLLPHCWLSPEKNIVVSIVVSLGTFAGAK